MIVLICSVILIILIIVLAVKIDEPSILYLVLICIMIGAVCECIPSGEYSEWETKNQFQLLQLSEGQEKYLRYSDDSVTFRYLTESEYGDELILAKITTDDNTKIELHEIEGQEAYLVIKERTGVGSIWTFTPQQTQTIYIYYVPDGTIINERVIKVN